MPDHSHSSFLTESLLIELDWSHMLDVTATGVVSGPCKVKPMVGTFVMAVFFSCPYILIPQ